MPISDAKLKDAVMAGALGDGPVDIPDPLGKSGTGRWRMAYDPGSKRFTILTDPGDDYRPVGPRPQRGGFGSAPGAEG